LSANFAPNFPSIGFIPKLRNGRKIPYVGKYEAPSFMAGLKIRHDVVVHIKTAAELKSDRDKAAQDKSRNVRRIPKIDFQILLDAKTISPVTSNDMVVGGLYYLVSQMNNTQHVRYCYLVFGESHASIGVEDAISWAGRKDTAPREYYDIIDVATTYMGAPALQALEKVAK